MKKYILVLALLVSFLSLGANVDKVIYACHTAIVLPLNATEKMVFQLFKGLDEADDATTMTILLVLGDTIFALGEDQLLLICQRLKDNLLFVLTTDMELHESIRDIGYEFNEWAQQRPVPTIDVDGEMVWPGFLHMICCVDVAVWLYACNKDIVFEVTGVYRPAFNQPYDVWIKKNKIRMLKRVISRDIAEQWLQQVDDILNTIYSNIARKQSKVKPRFFVSEASKS